MKWYERMKIEKSRVRIAGILIGLIAAVSASGHGETLASVTSRSAPEPLAQIGNAVEHRAELLGGHRLVLSASGAVLTLRDAGNRAIRTFRLSEPRINATLTGLPSGRVLVWGGTNAQGALHTDGLWFDVHSKTLESARDLAIGPRTGHSATVLTDGRVLFVGGRSKQGAELWDEESNSAIALEGGAVRSRSGHLAKLQADGSVRLFGGRKDPGDPQVVRFDSAKLVFQDMSHARPEADPYPGIAGSLPAQGAREVAPESRLAVRFTQPVRLTDLQPSKVLLVGPGGATPARIVSSEEGRLVFIRPIQPMFPGSRYTLLLDGLHTRAGAPVPLVTIDFQTAALSANAPVTHLPKPVAATNGLQHSTLTTCGHGTRPYPCPANASLKAGVWTPGRNSTDGRWRIAKPQPAVKQFTPLIPLSLGFTTLIGQIRRVDDEPVGNVEVSIGRVSAKTDAEGYFRLHGAPIGQQELYVDGSSANGRGIEYGQFVVGVDVVAGKVTQLPYTMYLPRITARDKVSIASPLKHDVVLKHPDMPGLMVQIPAGTVIRDRKGRLVQELAIVPTPVNRAPFPVADNYPMYFTLEPGGAVIQGLTPEAAKGVRIFYPNYDRHPAGTQANFWIYDPAEGWRIYGKGRVTSNGKVFSPEQGVALHQTMGGSYSVDKTDPPPEEERPECNESCGSAQGGGGATAGDPIDLLTGKFYYDETDIVIPDVVPIRIGRSYRPTDTLQRSFGLATSLNYDYKLAATSNDYNEIRLVLPNGVPVLFNRISGTGLSGAWSHSNSSTIFNGAKLEWVLLTGFDLTFGDGSRWRFDKYAPNRLLWAEDRFGNRTEFAYDAGLLSRITSPGGRYISLEYDAQNRIQTARDLTGNAWSYAYDGVSGLLARVTYPDLSFKQYVYQHRTLQDLTCPEGASQKQCAYYVAHSGLGRTIHQHAVKSIIDRRGIKVLENEFEPMPLGWIGRINKQILADNSFYSINYAHSDGATTGTLVTNPDGSKRRITYAAGTRYPQTDTVGYGTPLAQTVRFERNTASQITARIDAMGRRIEYVYNSANRVTRITALAGTPKARSAWFEYGQGGLLLTVTDSLSRTTALEYLDGCVVGVVDAMNRRTRMTCNGAGQLTSVTDPLGKTASLHYVGYDLVEAVDPLGRSTRFRHDLLGRTIAMEDAQGRISHSEYDAEHRLVKQIDPAENVTELGYDANGNLTAVLLPHGNGVTYHYDPRNRVLNRTDSLNQVESWTYDFMDRVKTYRDRKSQLTLLDYDVLGRLEVTTYHDANTITANYDVGNRLLNLVDTLTGALSWQYDELDRLQSTTSPQGSISYEYDDANRRTAMTAANQPRLEYQYDAGDRLRRMLQGSDVVEFDYDDADRLLETRLPNGIKTGYAYNDASQITGIAWLKPDSTLLGDLGYGYNTAGEIAAHTGSFASNTMSAVSTGNEFDDNNRQTKHNGSMLTYDANGNMTGDGVRTYVWNARNQLVEITQGGNAIANFSYDALGRRYNRTEAGQTTSYLYDGADAVQEVREGVANPILTGLGIDQRFARNDNGGRTYFLTDALGSTRALTNASGQMVQRYDYTPYGQTTQSASGFSNPYQYTGREKDSSGLYYYRARYYQADAGRFTAEDPIGFAGGDWNTYAYVRGDPILYRDPTGEFLLPGAIAGAILGGISGGFGAAATGGNVWQGALVGALTGTVVGLTGGLLAGSLTGGSLLGAHVAMRAGASALGNLSGQGLNVGSPCYQGINYGSLIGSTLGGAAGGLLAPGAHGARFGGGLFPQMGQRVLAGIPGTGVSGTSSVIGTSLGRQR